MILNVSTGVKKRGKGGIKTSRGNGGDAFYACSSVCARIIERSFLPRRS